MFYRDTWAEINLDALRHNCREIQKLTNKKMIDTICDTTYNVNRRYNKCQNGIN